MYVWFPGDMTVVALRSALQRVRCTNAATLSFSPAVFNHAHFSLVPGWTGT